ncbi:MAG: T9SS C-terminal target domain-containing protein [Cryomorphaceae bacterium]|nr:MAG: T9SS C-terminal target domain-containing protein [Cryomorphaceae bacterium]
MTTLNIVLTSRRRLHNLVYKGHRRAEITLLWVLIFFLQSTITEAQITWRRTYGGELDDTGVTVRVLDQNRFVVAASTGSFGVDASSIYLFETDGLGNRTWSALIGDGGIFRALDMQVDEDGDLLIVGFTNVDAVGGYDALLVRADQQGTELWRKTYGGTDWDFFSDIKLLENGNMLITGQTFSVEEPGGNAWLILCDSDGEIIWERTLGGSGLHDGWASTPVPDGGFAMTGSLLAENGETDGFLARYDESGNLLWLQTYGGEGSDELRDVIVTNDGGFSMVGMTRSFEDFFEAWHLKVDDSGGEEWYRNWGQIDNQESYRHIQLADGRYITVGYAETSGAGGKDLFLLRSLPSGDFDFGKTFGGIEDDEGYSLGLLDDGFILVGYTLSFGQGSRDVFLVRTNLEGETEDETVIEDFDPVSTPELASAKVTVYPNPSTGLFFVDSDELLIEAVLWDITGRPGKAVRDESGLTALHFDVPAGMYMLELRSLGGIHYKTRIIIGR